MEELDLSGNVKEDSRRRFEADWLVGNPQPLREYLPAEDDPRYLPTLVELVSIELEFRWRTAKLEGQVAGSGTIRYVEDYAREFPILLRVPLLRRIVREECIARATCGERPTADEFRNRFPQLADIADGQLLPDDSEVEARSQSLSTFHAARGEIPTERYVAPPNQDTIDPTLTYCVRGNDGPMEIPAVRHRGAAKFAGFTKGMLVAGRYQLDEELGRGGMGLVFLAHDTRLDRSVAVKVMLIPPKSRAAAEMQEWQQMFADEAKLGAGLLHPAIATVFDYGVHEGLPFTIFEFVRGVSLRDLIRQRAPLPIEDVRRIIAPLAQGLDFAHQRRIVHRDLKPENIRATEDEHFKILDLGLAKRFDLTENDWRFSGTPAYAAPEQAAEKPSDGRVDQYALALITFELLTGKRPFQGTTPWDYLKLHQTASPPPPRKLVASVPIDVNAAVLKALEKNPNDRFATCEEFAAAIGCRLLSQVATLSPELLEQDVRVTRSSFSLGWSMARIGAHLMLLPDSLWVYHRGGIHRLPLGGIKDIRRTLLGNTLQVLWQGDGTSWKRAWRFPNVATCGRWEEALRRLSQQARGFPAAVNLPSVRPPMMLLKSKPHALFQILGHLDVRQRNRWTAVASLSLRAAAAGADAVVDVTSERLYGPQKSEHRLSGKPVNVTGEQGIVELATRWSAEEIARLAVSAGTLTGIVLSLFGILAALPSLVRWLAGGSLGVLGVALDFQGEIALGMGVPLLCSLAWPFVLFLLLHWLKWPQLVRVAAVATGAVAISPILGKLLSIAIYGLSPRDWYGQLQVLAELGGHLLFAVWFWDLSRQLGDLARQLDLLFARREPPKQRRNVARGLHGMTATFALLLISFTSWLACGTLRNSGSTNLLAYSLKQRMQSVQSSLLNWQQTATSTDGKLALLSQLVEQGKVRDATAPNAKSDATARIRSFAADSDPKVRTAACAALATLRASSTEVVEVLAERLVDEVAEVRQSAFNALQLVSQGRRGARSEKTIPNLLEYLSVCESGRRHEVAALLQHLDNQWSTRPEALTLAEQLAKELRSSDKEVRIDAAEFLARLGVAAKPVLMQVIEHLGDNESRVRIAAQKTLDTIEPNWRQSPTGSKVAANLLAQLGRDGFEERLNAVELLANLNNDWNRRDAARDALPKLIEVLAVARGPQQQTVASILDRIDADWRKQQSCDGSVAVLVERLRSSSSEERITAVTGLRIFASAASRSIGPLLDQVVEADSSVQAFLIQALDAIDPKWGESPEYFERTGIFTECLEHPKSERRLAGVQLLSRSNNVVENIGVRIAERLTDEDSNVRRGARDALLRQINPIGAETFSTMIRALLATPMNRTADEIPALTTLLERIDKSWRSHPVAIEVCENAARMIQSDVDAERRTAANILPLFGPTAQRYVPLLMPLLIDRDLNTRASAQLAIQSLDANWRASNAFHEMLPHIVSRLDSQDIEARISAIQLLGQLGPTTLTNKNDAIWEQWRTWLVSHSPQMVEIVNALIRQMDDSEPRVREASATTLSRLGTLATPATNALARHLVDPSPMVRRNVQMALPRVSSNWRQEPGVSHAATEICKELDDGTVETRLVALEALSFLGPLAAPATDRLEVALDDQDLRIQTKAMEVLGRIGPSASSAIAALVKKRGNPSQRYAAEQTLTRIKADWQQEVPQQDLVQSLQETLKKRPHQRWDALNQLRALRAQALTALPEVAKLVVDQDDRLRPAAFETLDAIAPEWRSTPTGEKVMGELLDSLGKANDRVRLSSLQALGRFGRKSAIARPALLPLAQHSDARVRDAAFAAIGAVCEPDSTVMDVLANGLRSSTASTRAAAVQALTKIDPNWQEHPTAKQALDDWQAQLKNPRAPARTEALNQLRAISVPSAQIVQVVAQSLKDNDAQVRQTAISVLQKWGPAANTAMPELMEMTDDAPPHVRSLVAQAVEKIDPQWRNHPSAAELKRRILRRIQDDDVESRRIGVEVLSRWTVGAPDERLDVLLPLLGDRDAAIHQSVARLLNQDARPWRNDSRVKTLIPLWLQQLLDEVPDRRLGAIRALTVAAPGASDTLESLIAAAGDGEVRVRQAAIDSLAKFQTEIAGNPNARDAIIRCVAHPMTTQSALTMLNTHWPDWRTSTKAQQEVDRLMEALSPSSDKQRDALMNALGQFGKASRPAIELILKKSAEMESDAVVWSTLGNIDPNWKELPEVNPALEWLANELRNTDSARRIRVARTMGRTNDSAVPILIESLADSDIRVRIAIIQAVGNLKNAEALPALREQLLIPGAKSTAELAIRQIESEKVRRSNATNGRSP